MPLPKSTLPDAYSHGAPILYQVQTMPRATASLLCAAYFEMDLENLQATAMPWARHEEVLQRQLFDQAVAQHEQASASLHWLLSWARTAYGAHVGAV